MTNGLSRPILKPRTAKKLIATEHVLWIEDFTFVPQSTVFGFFLSILNPIHGP